MSASEPGEKNSLQQYLEKLLAEEAQKAKEAEVAPGLGQTAEASAVPTAEKAPSGTPAPTSSPAPSQKAEPPEPPKSPEWDALGSLLSQALGEAKEAPPPSAPSASSRAAAAPPPAPAAPPRPDPATPPPPAQPALEEVRREAERLLAQALKEADELRRQAADEAEAIRALARAEREAARREKAEAMAKLAELDSRLHAAMLVPTATPPPAATPPAPAPPASTTKVEATPLAPPAPPAAKPAAAAEKAAKRPLFSFFQRGKGEKPAPAKRPAAAVAAAASQSQTAPDPTETYQGEVQVKITAPVDWPRLHRLEQALSSKSGLALRGTRSTAEGTFMHLKLSQPMSLIQTLMETEVVIAALPGGHDKTGGRRLEVTLGEAPPALPPGDTPERQVSIPLAPATPPRARGHQGRAYLTVAPLPSLQELGRFQGLLQGIPGVSIVATAAATDRRGAVFTLELKDVSLDARLEEAIPNSRFQEEGPNRFLLTLPQAW